MHSHPYWRGRRSAVVLPPNISAVVPRTVLMVDNHTLLYNAIGYKVSQVFASVARLWFTLTPELCFHVHRNAPITHASETEGILLHIPINMILQPGDLLMLWTTFEINFDHPLVTSFVVHDATLFRL